MKLRGVLAPIPTPFRDEAIDLDVLVRNLRFWLGSELCGIVVLGTNGEAAHVDDDEADLLIAKTREVVPADRTLVAGTARIYPSHNLGDTARRGLGCGRRARSDPGIL